jgi:hypothetical protein
LWLCGFDVANPRNSVLRHRFYDVPTATYLFRGVVTASDDRKAPEEPVRQWCAFELMRGYGILVGDIVFEQPVKVGSKQYRIDILVKRNGFPWIVAECKEQAYTRHDNAIAQAISYADAREIQAEYVLYTNGAEWLVRRKVQGEWVAVPDLPNGHLPGRIVPLREMMNAVYQIQPLLHKLDEPIAGMDAERFFEAMQYFFCGYNLFTDSNKPVLVNATDNLCRVLSVKGAGKDYYWGKLASAAKEFGQFCDLIGFQSTVHDIDTGGMFAAEIARIRLRLEEIIAGTTGSNSCDVLLMRLNIALLTYGERAARENEKFLPVTPEIHRTLRDLLNYGLAVHFNTQIPDPIDTDAMFDVKSCCGATWERD